MSTSLAQSFVIAILLGSSMLTSAEICECNKVKYTCSLQKCCHGKRLYLPSLQRCCSDGTTQVHGFSCDLCSGRTYFIYTHGCCGGTIYNRFKHKCCSGTIKGIFQLCYGGWWG